MPKGKTTENQTRRKKHRTIKQPGLNLSSRRRLVSRCVTANWVISSLLSMTLSLSYFHSSRFARSTLDPFMRLSQAQTVSKGLCYTQRDQASFLPLVPKRLTPSGWPGVLNALTCARRSLQTFPASRGFMYNRMSGLCSPQLWMEGSAAPGALTVQPEEGDLYLSCGICGDGFEIMEFGDAGNLACLRHVNTTLVTQQEARSKCTAWRAHLVSVKTVAKLQLVRNIATVNTWVGFEFLRSQGIHVWTGDGEKVTNQQIQDVFNEGEPNDYGGNEDCGHFSGDYLKLNDEPCDRKYPYICEKHLPV